MVHPYYYNVIPNMAALLKEVPYSKFKSHLAIVKVIAAAVRRQLVIS